MYVSKFGKKESTRELQCERYNYFSVDECVLRFVDVHIGYNPDDFLTNGAKMCVRNASMGSMIEVVTRCIQPLVGQYVTINNLVYIESETYEQEYEKCLVICEVEVYVRGKAGIDPFLFIIFSILNNR